LPFSDAGQIIGDMSASLFVRGFRRAAKRIHCTSAGPATNLATGLSLIELLVVLFIISMMIALLLPALQSARAKARSTQCVNNVRQLGFALQRYIDTSKKFPQPNHWAISPLKFIEEWPLADAIGNEIPHNQKIGRPPLFSCPAQPEVETNVDGVYACHYVLTVDRPIRGRPERVRWDLHDRERLSENDKYEPWYVGPEITVAEQQSLFATNNGPHPSGVFYTRRGATGGGE
jgi:type II secretory pathway pseudopilin PulG